MPRRSHRSLAVLVALLFGGLALLAILPHLPASWRARWARGTPPRAVGASYPLIVTDATGRTVVVRRRPERIVSIAPSVTEILFAIGAGHRVVADTIYCDYPPEAAKLEKIGGYVDPDVEKILARSPDIVLGARGNRRDIITHMESLGLTVVTVDPTNLDDVTRDIRLLGRVVGEAENAQRLASTLEARIEGVVSKTRDLPAARRPRVLFLFSLRDLFSAGPGSHIDDLIRRAGGRNIAANTATPWPELSLETAIAADPQVILLLAGQMAKDPLTPEKALARLRADRRWRYMSAVKDGRVALLDDDAVTLPGPRLVDGLEEMAAALHPDLFPAKERP